MSNEDAILTPATFAVKASWGRWRPAKHLKKLDRAITDTITGVDGIRRLMVSMPPRSGKSWLMCRYLPAWYLGTFPDNRVILCGYGNEFAQEWGRHSRNILDEWGHLFPNCVRVAKESAAAGRWSVEGHLGGMYAVGVGGAITGRGANLLIGDDLVKGQKEAKSETFRNDTWEWWLENAYTRLEPDGSVIIIGTRWHEDDVIGRIRQQTRDGGEPWRELVLPAIAEENDPIQRQPGEPLWPERYDIKALERIKSTLGEWRFSALYQQRPTPREGGFFKRKSFEIIERAPEGMDTQYVRAWDKAATNDGGDYTVGVLMGRYKDQPVILDVVRGQWDSGKRDDGIDMVAAGDYGKFGRRVKTWFEQEPGSGGKQSAEISKGRLASAGFRVDFERVTGEKTARADAMASTVSLRGCKLVRAKWNQAFVDELAAFDAGAHDDQVDASSLAFNHLFVPRARFLVAQ